MTDNEMTDTQPRSIAQMRQEATDVRAALAGRLKQERDRRDKLNADIKDLVAKHDEADRVVRALTPKTRTAKK